MKESRTKPNRRTWLDWVGFIARLVTGVVLLVAGLLKVVDLVAMRRAIEAYQLFPDAIVGVLTYAVPLSEIILGALLLLGLFTRISAIFSGLLFLGFIVGIASAWARGLSLDCGCFGGGGEIDPAQTRYAEELLRDLGLLALCLWLSLRPHTPYSVDQWLFAINLPDVQEADDV
ncbi:MAG: MauE/DoxX family redox-associated membrane protein [Propionibacteriaceae bacterium]|nr:MauE/DoxX family redox-associated membrane protein [Propionibacteriaceae bacterium]